MRIITEFHNFPHFVEKAVENNVSHCAKPYEQPAENTCKKQILHGFATRNGGITEDAFLGRLNLGFSVGEKREKTLENYKIFAEAVGVSYGDMVCAYQLHTTNVLAVDAAHRGMGLRRPHGELLAETPFAPWAEEGFDGLVTRECDVALVVRCADCVPILFCDDKNGVIGACHAGWRGTVGGIGARVVEKMCEIGAMREHIHAVIGPAIGLCCYEVDDGFYKTFLHTLGEDVCAEIFSKSPLFENPDKYHCDLKGCNRILLERAGVPAANITVSNDCTCCMHGTYHSHRYAMRRQGGKRGLGGAVICMKD